MKPLLYPPSFIRSIPPPATWDHRPLAALLASANPDQELNHLDRWYRNLKSGQRTDPEKRLRSLTYRDFWSGYAELLTARLAVELEASSVRHSPKLRGKRPDFVVSSPDENRQSWEAAIAFQRREEERNHEQAYDPANRLNRGFCIPGALLLIQLILKEEGFHTGVLGR